MLDGATIRLSMILGSSCRAMLGAPLHGGCGSYSDRPPAYAAAWARTSATTTVERGPSLPDELIADTSTL